MVDMSREALIELAERVEKAEGGCRELDWLAHRERHARLIDDTTYCYFGPEKDGRWLTYRLPHRWPWSRALAPRYTADLNAAMSLVPEGWSWSVTAETERLLSGHSPYSASVRRYWSSYDKDYFCRAATPALALVSAALRARSAATL